MRLPSMTTEECCSNLPSATLTILAFRMVIVCESAGIPITGDNSTTLSHAAARMSRGAFMGENMIDREWRASALSASSIVYSALMRPASSHEDRPRDCANCPAVVAHADRHAESLALVPTTSVDLVAVRRRERAALGRHRNRRCARAVAPVDAVRPRIDQPRIRELEGDGVRGLVGDPRRRADH